LDAFLKITASSNQAGRSPEELVQGAGQFLTAFGLNKDGANLLDLGVRSRGLFAQTDFQVGDLSSFAQSAGTFAAAGIPLQETLSANAILREQMAASEAATQGRNVVSAFQTFGADNKKSGTLKDQLGLSPADIDLVGETLPAALKKLGAAINAVPKEQQAPILATLFGKENLRGAQALLGGVGKFDSFATLQQDREGFVQGVNIAQSGPNAAARRIKIDETIFKLQEEQETTRRYVAGKRLDLAQARNYQSTNIIGDVGVGIGNAIEESAIYLGVDPTNFLSPEAKREASGAQRSSFTTSQLENALGDNARQQRENGAVLRDMTEALRQNTEALNAARRNTPRQSPTRALGN
ncbi:MAG: phage tail tape measure protein, partial [Planctomycetaceae bacterium]|nr:phage tail tape measure protein [Planctomycetaceae bacterium]